jgi:hypothetical protein
MLLAAGNSLLAASCWQLAAGNWRLAAGNWLLADCKCYVEYYDFTIMISKE